MTDELAPPGTFRRQIWDELSSPKPLRGYFGRRLMGAFGLLFDALADATSQAVKVGWILENPPQDAVGPLGREALLNRYPTESDAQHVARISRAWEDWTRAGDESSIIGQLAAAGYPGARIFRWTVESWSEFTVFFPEGTHTVTAPSSTYDSGHTYGDGLIYGPVGITTTDVETIRGIVKQWKPGRWVCKDIVFEIRGPTYGTGHIYGESGLEYGALHASIGGI